MVGAATWFGNGLASLSLTTWATYMLASRQLRTGMSVATLMASALPVATAVTLGALASTEAADAAAIAGLTGQFGALTASEVGDTAQIACSVTWLAALAVTEGYDTAAISGVVGLVGSLGATEGADTALVSGAVRWVATLAATEATDTASITGGIVATGTLAATEAADTAFIISDAHPIGALQQRSGRRCEHQRPHRVARGPGRDRSGR
jgi:hypothetical protein